MTAGDNPVIQIRELVKTFGRTRALDGLDLRVAQGQVHGFLGPNGAGKSTTIRVLLGLLRADSGAVRLLGGDPWSQATELHRRLAYVPGDVTLWPTLTGGEIIDLMARMRGRGDTTKRDALIERFELDPRKRARTYSTGNRQKVALVSALSSNAELLVLDEPTSGLDPLMEVTFRQCLLEESAAGRTVLLSSHLLSEVEAVCDRVTIVRRGRTVESGTLAELRHLTRTAVEAELASVPDELRHHDAVHALAVEDHSEGHVEGHTVRFQVEPAQMEQVMPVLLAGGLRDLVARPPSLEDLFLEHYQHTADPAPREAQATDHGRHAAARTR